MKNARPQDAETSAHKQGHYISIKRLAGIDCARHFRALQALLTGPTPRESLDTVACCSNSPELGAEFRLCGLAIPCERSRSTDRDGQLCRSGIYHLGAKGHRLIYEWLARGSNDGNR